MSIGVFARRSRLSQKALRLYNSMGLLAPALIDPETGYRHYSEDQLERAKLIGLLRQIGMPLDRIASVLDLRCAAAVSAVAAYWAETEADVRTRRRLVHYLQDYLEGKGEAMFDVQTRNVPHQKVLTIQRKVYAKDLPEFIRQSMGQIFHYVAAAGLKVTAAPLVIYHGEVNEDSDGPVEVCVPFEGSLEPAGEMRIRLEPAHREAYTRITKAQVEFPGILKAYDAVAEWLKTHGQSWSDSPREVYFADWDGIGPDDPACDIAFPTA